MSSVRFDLHGPGWTIQVCRTCYDRAATSSTTRQPSLNPVPEAFR